MKDLYSRLRVYIFVWCVFTCFHVCTWLVRSFIRLHPLESYKGCIQSDQASQANQAWPPKNQNSGMPLSNRSLSNDRGRLVDSTLDLRSALVQSKPRLCALCRRPLLQILLLNPSISYPYGITPLPAQAARGLKQASTMQQKEVRGRGAANPSAQSHIYMIYTYVSNVRMHAWMHVCVHIYIWERHL